MPETYAQPDVTPKKRGIINQVAKPDQYKAPEVKPVTTEVDAGQETVESRLNKLTASGSKYTDLAGKDAMRNANTRGLINSSMAAAAGTDASIRAGLPIAQQDAKTYTDTRFNNQNVQNEFLKNRQSANLNMETAAQGSGLVKSEATHQSGLTNTENTLLNDLSMKRDNNASSLTQDENEQLNELEMKRDSAQSGQRIDEAAAQNRFDIKRDTNSAGLNESLAKLESTLEKSEMRLDATLKERLEKTLNDAKFDDEAKIRILDNMHKIITDSQQQIVDIGMSDRTADQQASAIALVEDQRDASLDVYETLLESFNDWDWGTDFTPEQVGTKPPPIPEGSISDGKGGYYWPENPNQNEIDWGIG